MTLRVAVDASELAWGVGGIGRYLEAVLRELAQDPRLELTLITNASSPVTDIPGTEERNARVKGGPLWRSTALISQARAAKADLLWCPSPLCPIRPLDLPLVVTVHDLSPVLHRGTKPLTETVAMAVAGRLGARRAQRILCVSQSTSTDLQQHWGIGEERLAIVPLAVGSQFHPGDRAAAADRVARRWDLRQPFLLAAGTIEPRKGYDLLVELAGLQELPIVIAGRNGPHSDQLVRQLKATCVLLGGVTDEELINLYRAAELLLTPSLYEGFGLTPLEAMACGTPALVAQGAGALEEMAALGATRVPRRATGWAAAVDGLRGRREEASVTGHALATSRTWTHVANETVQTLLDAAR
ncbi:glycosyltransferase family 1 protein [Aeromicrobium sp.]|uniref:glycosyltransferase family 4 protein n=1 Tax=Aeromicrobium sp. TaxID=1871063 RepID=UPI0019B07E53|nr:glycosyltransferase family 1 protein [Aeromicrobium sp.]MBC7630436.1 glycosyltransferase family 4 protein [Aeromicrobium sp.]